MIAATARRRGGLGFGIFTLAMVALFIGLGAWQLQRRVAKHALIAALTERLAAAPNALPAEGQWQLVLCKHTGQWGTERFEAEDLGKVPMMKTAIPKQEVMSIGFEKTAGKKTQLHVKWDTLAVSVPVTAM